MNAPNPYEPPIALGSAQYRPLEWKTHLAVVGIFANVVCSLGLGVLTLMLQDATAKDRVAFAAVVGVLGMATTVIAIATAIVFLVWMHQAAINVRAFGQDGLLHSPAWAVGCWFVPFANLAVPFSALKEIWCASDPNSVGEDGTSWSDSVAPTLFPFWWAAYLGHNVVGYLGAFLIYIGTRDHELEIKTDGALTTLGANFFYVIAAVMIVTIMKRLDRRQQICAQKLALA